MSYAFVHFEHNEKNNRILKEKNEKEGKKIQ